jgi:protein-tyrosine-phosphatase
MVASLLFICTTNQVRSPIAVEMFKALLPRDQVANWQVASAGMWTQEGLPAGTIAQQVM